MEHNNYGCSQWLLYADRLWSYRSVAPNHLNKKNREDVCFVSSTVIFMASVQTDYKYTHIYPTNTLTYTQQIHSHIPNKYSHIPNKYTHIYPTIHSHIPNKYTHIYPTNTRTYTQQYTHIYPTNALVYTQQIHSHIPNNTLTYSQQIHIIKSHQTAFLLF